MQPKKQEHQFLNKNNMTDIDYKQKCEEYEQLLGIGGNDIAKDAFIALCRITKQQTKRLSKFDLEKEIGVNAKEDKVYDRTMDIVVKMPKMISDINTLRKELNISNNQIEEAFTDGIAEKRA